MEGSTFEQYTTVEIVLIVTPTMTGNITDFLK